MKIMKSRISNVPAVWLKNERWFDVIGRDRHLCEVIKKVIEQDLCGQHRKKRQKERGAGHAEHIAKVGAGSHQQIFHHVAERLSSLDNTSAQNAQVLQSMISAASRATSTA